MAAHASPVPVSPPCCFTTKSTLWSLAIGPSSRNRSTHSLRLPPLVWPNVSTCGTPRGARLEEPLRENRQPAGALGVDRAEHQQRLQPQVAPPLRHLLRL